MLAIIAPEPAPWIEPVARAHDGPVWLFAPWDLSRERALSPWLSRKIPARWIAPALDRARVRALPGWPALIALSRQWERGRTDRQLEARFAVRALVDRLASELLPRETRAVIAPSCGARLVFARAQSQRNSITRTLIQDLPVLSGLHEDLDRAARAHPESVFLQRFRARHATVTRQRAEWQLATEVRARGAYTADKLRAWGCTSAVIEPQPIAREIPVRDGPVRTLLLAGFAAARNGTHEALALLEAHPGAVLLVRRGEGSEPAALFAHPRVRESTEHERATLEGVDAVLAPAWCECDPPEVRVAFARGVRVIASAPAMGAFARDQWERFTSPSRSERGSSQSP